MILEITSTLSTYKSMKFKPGLNIVLAEQHSKATDQDTRNGVGKSSLLDIMHFLLGASVGSGSLFRAAELEKVKFSGKFLFTDEVWQVTRDTEVPSVVSLLRPTSENDHEDTLFPTSGLYTDLRVKDWTELLTKKIFKIDCQAKDKYCLSSRILYGYLIRRQADGAFREFSESMAKQAKLPQQAAMLYFLGLDWTIARDWIILSEKLKTVSNFESMAKNADLKDVFPKEDELRSQTIIEQRRLQQMRQGIDNFQLLPEYKELEKEADEITKKLRIISDEHTQDNVRLENLNQSLESEAVVSESDNLRNFITQVQALFKEDVLERLSKVKEFHASVLQNRQEYLKQEIGQLQQRAASRNTEQRLLISRQAEVLGVLKASGGLDQYNKLNRELAKQEAKVEYLEKQLKKAREIALIKIECDEERARLAHRLLINYTEQNEDITNAISLYQEISNQLYEQSGFLVVGQSENGPDINIKKSGQRSKGIKNMQIFTFDLTIAVLMALRGEGPRCLVHDSHIFDGVDPRQVKTALIVAKNMCKKHNIQYIVCLNSDQLEDQEAYKQEIVQPILYDHVDDGGLFGFRFN
ncbi:DUF2326 domain-containing protein [Deinococcus sp. RIT780]|uniref:DUF2326 domain-containing protein n=1 Tax=Deinococcus sp. RIT780 TaxID=2870472 RepID=UPI001C8A178A|nr:DUF2326 domain-containing protein [Deinococcus sp. RIT780]MBX8464321.1 DUF2326 domain-containing protein [Deinococcus sp. RIT780]